MDYLRYTEAHIAKYPDALEQVIDCSGIKIQTLDWALRPGIQKLMDFRPAQEAGSKNKEQNIGGRRTPLPGFPPHSSSRY